MRVCHVILSSAVAVLIALPAAAQTPVLGSIEAPYPALQSQVRIAGGTYGPGAVPYGPAGTPLVLTGSSLGSSGTVQFVAYKNGAVDPSYTTDATVTQWNSTMLFLTVPSGATSGLVTVTVEGKASNGLPFIVTPGDYTGSCPAFPAQTQLQITTASLHDGTAGQSYSATLNATGGTQSYTWSLASGSSLPGGLSLNASTGVISGTPTGAAGPLDLTVEVTDSSNPKLTNEAVLSLTVESPTLNSAAIYSYAVPSGGFDSVGNITAFQDSIMGNWSFQFDTLNRLVSGNATTGGYSGQNACWTYDSFGNRTSEAVSPTACNSNPPLLIWATYTTSNTNRMDTDSDSNLYGRYPVSDAAGNLTSDGGNTYLYDAEGRICAVQSTPIAGYTAMTGYLYNSAGERIAKGTITAMSCDPVASGFQLTESYVLGQGGEELTQLDGNNNWQRTNVYGAGKQLATYDLISDPTNTSPNLVPALHFQLTDPLGTRRMQVSASGQPETDIQSLPFGDQLNSFPDQYAPATADDATPLHFTGHERDQESGNDYFGARYYASSMGRWLSPDKPFADQHAQNPQSWNLYAYARNNPLIIFDPNGEAAVVLVNGNNVTIYFPVSFSGNANTPANQAAYTAAITSAWTGQFGNYNTTMHVVPGDPGSPLTNDVHINAPTPADGAFPRPTTDVGGPNMNLFGLGDNAAQNNYEKWASGHETGHGMGEQDQYHDATGPNPGYEHNIMGAVNGTPDARDINNVLAFHGNTVINATPSTSLSTETTTVNQTIPLIQPQQLQLQPRNIQQ